MLGNQNLGIFFYINESFHLFTKLNKLNIYARLFPKNLKTPRGVAAPRALVKPARRPYDRIVAYSGPFAEAGGLIV